jgi:cytochrome c551/c552
MKKLTSIVTTVTSLSALSALLMGISIPISAKDISLPPETIAWRESALPGYQKVLQQCMTCHSALYAEYQPTTTTRGYWEAQVKRMKNVFNAPLADADIPLITDYLVNTYSVERSSPPPKLSAAGSHSVAAAATASAKTANVSALLQNNACLSCHAIDRKLVGPAYKEVAAKYGNDKDALGKVMASIKNGGSGRWGAVPMPPYARLSPDELGALAKFVLQQK